MYSSRISTRLAFGSPMHVVSLNFERDVVARVHAAVGVRLGETSPMNWCETSSVNG